MAEQYTVLDFDETVYQRDSMITFYLFCLQRNPLLALWLPVQAGGFILHSLRLISTKEYKNIFLLFLSFYSLQRIHHLAGLFWKKEFPQRFNPALLKVMQESRYPVVIITASPLIYFGPVKALFPGVIFIGTQLECPHGLYRITGENCKGAEKIVAFHRQLGSGAIIHSAYSDSLSDQPLFDAATFAYRVVRGAIIPLNTQA
jgi:phosphatidylglycerophosphatase C